MEYSVNWFRLTQVFAAHGNDLRGTIATNENLVMATGIPAVGDLSCLPACLLLLFPSHDDNGDVVRLGMACGVTLDGRDEMIDDL